MAAYRLTLSLSYAGSQPLAGRLSSDVAQRIQGDLAKLVQFSHSSLHAENPGDMTLDFVAQDDVAAWQLRDRIVAFIEGVAYHQCEKLVVRESVLEPDWRTEREEEHESWPAPVTLAFAETVDPFARKRRRGS